MSDPAVHDGRHADCYDCATALCPDCKTGPPKCPRNCYGPPCACPRDHPAVTP